MSWKINGEPAQSHTSADETCWSVPLLADDGLAETSILASISGTAMAMPDEHLPDRVVEMRRTHGLSQVEFYLPWAEVPRKISGDSHWIHVELADGTIVQSFGS